MSTSSCVNCGRTFVDPGLVGGFLTAGDQPWIGNLCPDCLRQKKGQAAANAAASQQAGAAGASAEAQAQAAWHAADATAEAARRTAGAQAEAVLREAAAHEHLLAAQAEAALGQLSAQQLAQLGTFKRAEEDRINLQSLFDKLGNAIACIELGGKDTTHYREYGYPFEDPNGPSSVWDGRGHARNKVSFVYRYHNLACAMAHLLDLREEVQRIRNWDANVSRDETVRKIQDAVTEGKKLQADAAKRSVRIINSSRYYHLILPGILLLPGLYISVDPISGINGSAVAFASLASSSVVALVSLLVFGGRKPLGWDDMRELAGEE